MPCYCAFRTSASTGEAYNIALRADGGGIADKGHGGLVFIGNVHLCISFFVKSSSGVADPMIKDFHLLRCMEPVFSVLHYGEVCANSVCEPGNGFSGSQMIVFAIQNAGGDTPLDGMLSHIAQILPG